MKKLNICMAVCLLFASGMAAAQQDDQLSMGLRLAQVDYDVVHAALIARCKARYPDTVPALSTAISAWKDKNAAALQQLHALSRDNLVKTLNMSPKDADAQLKNASEALTKGLKGQFEHVADPDLKAACTGQYASQALTNPALDFNALLAKVQAQRVSPSE
jgi:hypothetical protein